MVIIFSAFTGWVAVFLTLQLLRFFKIQDQLKKEFATMVDMETILNKVDQLDVEEEVSELLDKRLHTLVEGMKSKIPLAGMFLAGSFAENLRQQAKEELMQLLPEFKELLKKRIEENFDVNKFLEEKLADTPLHKHSSIRKILWTLPLAGGAVGGIMGLLYFLIVGG